MTWRAKRAKARSTSEAWRSALEQRIAKQLETLDVEYTYEREKVYFTPVPKRKSKTWDFWITTRTGKLIVVETKGYWDYETRLAETEAIKQNPHLDVRYVFQKQSMPIRKGSRTTYAKWCDDHGIPHAEGAVPGSWLDE